MRRPSTRPALALVLASCLTTCGGEPPALVVGDVVFTERELLGLSADRRAALAEISALALAVNRGETVERATALRERAVQRSLVRALRTYRLLLAAEVGDDVLAARYELDPEFELDVRHLVILAERGFPATVRATAQEAAAAALARIRAGEPFEAVTAEVSEEPGAAERGGLLRPGRAGTWVDEFWSAALALEPGQVSGVVESPFGYHVLRLDGRRVVPFAEARDRVALEVADLLPQEPFDALRDSVAQSLVLDPTAAAWAEAGEERSLATWDGGALGIAGLRVYLQSAPDAVERGALAGGPRSLEIVREAAAEAALASIAHGLELAPDESAVAEELEDWRLTAEAWATTLGLVGSTDPVRIAEQALLALGATGQNAMVAREALRKERGPLLRSLYATATDGH